MSEVPQKILHLREEYSKSQLDESSVHPDPVQQFSDWMEQALNSDIKEPNAMGLATVNANGRPANRIVLLRGFDGQGFRFFTNYESSKGQALATHPFAALTFFWSELERQVRIEGRVEKTPASESDKYYNGRPRGSRLGAWASPQSKELNNRAELEQLHSDFVTRFEGQDVPRPENWGGYRLVPDRIEFWQGRPSRLHDRVCYLLEAGAWRIVRLAP